MVGKKRDDASETNEATVTILHVSDMQFGHNHRFGRLGLGGLDETFDTLLKRLTDDLDRLREDEDLVPDLVALTGDLAEWARPKEYADVLQFCEGLRAHLHLKADRVLVIPGNHDINRGLCDAYFKRCEEYGEKIVEPWWPKWEPYKDFFGKLYAGVDRYEFKETEPYTWFELPELKVVVAGLNSTMRESHKEKEAAESVFGHYGYVGEAQLHWFQKRLDEATAKEWLRIGMVHHNAIRGAELDDENLRDATLLEDRIGAKLNLLLHGHTHSGSLAWLGRDLPVISTGSAAVKVAQRPEEVPNQYQIVQVRREGFRCWGRQYTPNTRKWIGDTRVSKNGSDWRHEQRMDFPRTSGTFGKQRSASLATRAGAPPSADPTRVPVVTEPTPMTRRALVTPAPPLGEPDARELRKTLSAYFDTIPRVRMLLRDAGVDAGRVAFDGGVLDVWDNGLREAKKLNRLHRLLEIACDEYPEAADLRALASRLGA